MRITTSMRDSIVTKETAKKFDEVIAEAEKVLHAEVEVEAKKLQTTKIPQSLVDDRFVRVETDVRVDYGDDGREYYSLGTGLPIRWDESRHEVTATAKLKKLYKALQKLEEERTVFYKDLEKCLWAFTSSKPLITAMPELAIYFQDEDKAKSMAVIPYEQINNVRKQLVRP